MPLPEYGCTVIGIVVATHAGFWVPCGGVEGVLRRAYQRASPGAALLRADDSLADLFRSSTSSQLIGAVPS